MTGAVRSKPIVSVAWAKLPAASQTATYAGFAAPSAPVRVNGLAPVGSPDVALGQVSAGSVSLKL